MKIKEGRAKINKFLTLMFAILLALIFLSDYVDASDSKTPKFKWKLQCGFPESDGSFHILAKGVAKIIEETSEGLIEVKVYPAGALVAPEEMHSAVIDGSIEMAYDMAPASGELVPVSYTLSLYGGPQNLAEQYDLLYRMGLFQLAQKGFEKAGLHLIISPLVGREVLRARFRFDSWDAFKGKKGWASPGTVNVIQKLGGVCVNVPGYDMYTAMKLGAIEWHAWTIAELETMGWKEVTKSVVIDPPTLLPADVVYINPKAWNAIGAELQQKIEAQLRLKLMDLGLEYWDNDAKAILAAKKYGVEFIQLSSADKSKYQQYCVEDWDNLAASDPLAAEAIKIAKEFLRKMGRL